MKRFLFVLLFMLLPVVHAAPVYPDLTLYPQQVLRVYDGDTFYVVLPNIHPLFGDDLGIRLVGIDTPELRSECATEEERLYEKSLATLAKQYLTVKIQSAKIITLHLPDRDKYFRVDSTVLLDGEDVGQLLIANGYAVAYDGKSTKPSWCKNSVLYVGP